MPGSTPPRSRGTRLTGLRWVGIIAAIIGTIVIGTVLILLALGILGGDKGTETPTASATSGAPPTTAAPVEPTPSPGAPGATVWSIAHEFTSGDFTLNLESVTDGLTELGDDGQWTAAYGEFIVMRVSVSFKGTTPRAFPADLQQLIGTDGRVWKSDVTSLERLPGKPLGVDLLKPGETASGYLVFDIDQSITPTTLEFKGDMLADPIRIPLG